MTMLVGRRNDHPTKKRPTLRAIRCGHPGVLTHVFRGDIQMRRIVLTALQRVFFSRTHILFDVKLLYVRGTGSS